ncbi:hypothetical protein [Actinoplanes derwentensis]|uniref:Uncharacterized protein n=1 Tax=Actinoplanes derwentensis TaxID=113562 RepID=A0A1H1YND3_9ACTN|nr:hypothetical protein [Actinoplanes derwentensis]GID81219.1 hypothetical protein Ade03nite_01430 [Actinoplanes derwentensis]SDT22943.1 hypothetical protein SAMN04489716_2928 [Actinoplanes derwentensis]
MSEPVHMADSGTEPAVRGQRAQQTLLDAEVRASRREIPGYFRQRPHADAATLTEEDFLALADRDVVLSAVVIAARRVADACCLQVPGPRPPPRRDRDTPSSSTCGNWISSPSPVPGRCSTSPRCAGPGCGVPSGGRAPARG